VPWKNRWSRKLEKSMIQKIKKIRDLENPGHQRFLGKTNDPEN
jgi:hypothetical protein